MIEPEVDESEFNVLTDLIPPISDREFRLYQSFVYRTSGIYLSGSKKPLIVGRLFRRLFDLGVGSFGDYLDIVSSPGAPELTEMLDCLLTNKTSFFREPRHFDYLKDRVFPGWLNDCEAAKRDRRIRAWSAACSTGQEPYSLAMILLDHFPPSQGWLTEVLATDLSRKALRVTKAAKWHLEESSPIPREYLSRFMLKGKGAQDGYMRADRKLRSMVSCRPLNLNDDHFQSVGSFDVIFCRNVLMYFHVGSRRRVVEHLLTHLNSGGHLFLGHAEALDDSIPGITRVAPSVYMLKP